MKQHLSPILALLFSLTLLLSACAQAENNKAADNDAGSSVEGDPVVATVNGSNIYYSQFTEQMVSVESMYSSLTGTLSAEEINQKLTAQAESVLDMLIGQVILEQKAQEYGMTLSAEEEAEVAAAWDAVKDRFAVTIGANYPTVTGEDLDTMVLMALETSGLTEEMVTDSARTAALIANLRECIDAEVAVPTSAEIQSLYDRLRSEQQTKFDNNTSAFEAAMLGSEVVVYIPSDYRVIHEWEFRFSDENIALLNEMRDLDNDESTAYEEVLESERNILLAQIDAIRTRIRSGASFDEAFAELHPGQVPKVNYIAPETTRFSREYYEAAMSIDMPGGIAENNVALENGYYLLCWADSLEAGAIPLDDVKEALFQQILKEKQNKNWESVQAAWRKEAKITINEELITYS